MSKIYSYQIGNCQHLTIGYHITWINCHHSSLPLYIDCILKLLLKWYIKRKTTVSKYFNPTPWTLQQKERDYTLQTFIFELEFSNPKVIIASRVAWKGYNFSIMDATNSLWYNVNTVSAPLKGAASIQKIFFGPMHYSSLDQNSSMHV